LKKFMTNNKKTINYLVKEFEMKKKAAEYKRATVSKTGVLDTLKMNNYMFSDDVFKKMTILPEGKNHGLLMFIDWSGSMSDQLHHTVDQLLNLVMFCKQVNIPFQVYSFSDRWDRGQKFYPYDIFSENDLVYQEDFRLLELFSSKMNRSAFQTMAKAVIATANYWENRSNVYRGTSDVGSYSIPYSMWLGGTPLDDAIVSSIVLHDQFKKSNRLDIVNMVFLTDGASSAMEYIHNAEYLGRAGVVKERLSFGYYKAKDKVCYINNPVTKNRFRIDTNRDVTAQLIEIVRKHTNANIIGFHILPGRKPQAMREIPSKNIDWFDRENLWDNMRKDKFCLIPDCGYDAYFGVLGGKHLATSNGAIEVEDDASKAKIRTAFKKANSGRKTSRIMLSKFIDLVA